MARIIKVLIIKNINLIFGVAVFIFRKFVTRMGPLFQIFEVIPSKYTSYTYIKMCIPNNFCM